jgi:drug/metabolite transporter (DMT)-like permease
MRSPHHRLALLTLVTATFFTSTAGVLMRWIEQADGWTVLFWRALFCSATLLVWLAIRYGRGLPRAYLATGWTGVMMTVSFVLATITFIFALIETTVAKVVLINGMTPFVAAILAWATLGERVARSAVLFMLVAVAGIAVMVGHSLDSGHLAGDLLAFACCLTTAAMYVAMRRRTQIDQVPAILAASLAVALVAALFAPGLAVSGHDLLVCAALGCLQLGVQYILVAWAARQLPAAETALTARMTIVLGPLWAWLGAGEVPSNPTLWGGALVVVAILGNGLWSLHLSRAAAKVAPVT